MSEPSRFHAKLRIICEGPLLVGGHSPPFGDLDATTAQQDGKPVIPATAIKGAIREAAVQILSARDPATVPMPWVPRKGLDEGERAQARQLDAVFGPPGAGGDFLRTGETSPDAALAVVQGVRFGDARPLGTPVVATRHGVGIDRFTGARSAGRLYRRGVAEATGEVFEAELGGHLTSEARDLLRAACAVVQSIGNSQSRGIGHVRLELVEHGERPPSRWSLRTRGLEQGAARIVVHLEEPLHCGAVVDDGNLRETLDFIPGSALRGALVAAARDEGLDPSPLWATDVHVSDLLPGSDSKPHPRTWVEPKDKSVPPADECLEDAIRRELARLGLGAPEPSAARAPVPGFTGRGRVRTRWVTRLARDPATRSAAPGQLHAREQILPDDTRFWGTMVGMTGAALELVAKLQKHGVPLYVGALRTRGLGRVRVEVSPWQDQTLEGRIRRFSARSSSVLAGFESVIPWDPVALVQVVARTPIAVSGEDVGQQVATALFPGVEAKVRGSWLRYTPRGGWDGRKGAPWLRQVVDRGATWLIEVPGGALAHLPALRRAQTVGIGELTEHGLGRIAVCPMWE